MPKSHNDWNPFDLNGDGKVSPLEKTIISAIYHYYEERNSKKTDIDDVVDEYEWQYDYISNEYEDIGIDISDYDTKEEYLFDVLLYKWRKNYIDEAETYGLILTDYTTEEEFLFDLEELNWVEKYEDEALEYDLDPSMYDTEEDFLFDLDEIRYGWREDYFDEAEEIGLDPFMYDTEEDFLLDLDEIKYSWREDYCEAYKETGLDPELFETSDEYEEAVITWRQKKELEEEKIEKYKAAGKDFFRRNTWKIIGAIEYCVKENQIEEVQELFDTIMLEDCFDVFDRNFLVPVLIKILFDSENVEPLERFRDTLFQTVYRCTCKKTREKITEWEKMLSEKIELIIACNEKYQYTNNRTNTSDFAYPDPCYYETKEDYLAACRKHNNQKFEW